MSVFFTWQSFSEINNYDLYEILRARQEVFQIEQQIQYIDCDCQDFDAQHLCLWAESANSKELAAYLRILPPGKYETYTIGRVLTKQKFRGQGLGKQLMKELLATTEKKLGTGHLTMSAQAYLREFYEGFGFTVESEPYLEEGIEHIKMTRL